MTATTHPTIAAFITAQLDADEAAARAAAHQKVAGPFHGNWRADSYLLTRTGLEKADLAHIAMHDPARVLAQVAALRAVVELHRGVEYRRGVHCAQCWDTDYYEDGPAVPVAYPCPTLRAVASIWKDEPTFDAGWAE